MKRVQCPPDSSPFCSNNQNNSTSSPGFLGQRFNRVVQPLVMVNYACVFSQSESGKYFEWVLKWIMLPHECMQIMLIIWLSPLAASLNYSTIWMWLIAKLDDSRQGHFENGILRLFGLRQRIVTLKQEKGLDISINRISLWKSSQQQIFLTSSSLMSKKRIIWYRSLKKD